MILLKDPYALQVDRPQLPLTYSKRRIRQSISSITKKEIRRLFDAKCSKYTNVIIKSMESANVLDTKVFSNVYAASPEGVVEDICDKFQSSRSVEELIIMTRGKEFSRCTKMEV